MKDIRKAPSLRALQARRNEKLLTLEVVAPGTFKIVNFLHLYRALVLSYRYLKANSLRKPLKTLKQFIVSGNHLKYNKSLTLSREQWRVIRTALRFARAHYKANGLQDLEIATQNILDEIYRLWLD